MITDFSPAVIASIDKMLTLGGHPKPTAWHRFLHKDAFNEAATPEMRRFLINRAWRVILVRATEENTIDTRFCLLDQGPLTEWIKLINDDIIPCVIRNKLLFEG